MIKKSLRKILKIKRKKFYLEKLANISESEKVDFYENYIRKINDIIRTKISEKSIIGGFYPIKEELDCLFIIKKLQKNYITALPVVIDKSFMIFREYNSNSILIKDFMSIPAPSHQNNIVSPNIFLTPLLGFDKYNNRIGYGGGYYDRYFEKNKESFKIGLAFEIQKIDEIKNEDHDIKLDYIITEKNIYSK